MKQTTATLLAFLAGGQVALVEVAEAQGSTPREAGAWMLVSRERIFGTIGGGQLEYMAIDEARRMLGSGGSSPVPPPLTPPRKGEGKTGTLPPRLPKEQPAASVRETGAVAGGSPSPLRGGVRGGGTAASPLKLSIPLGPEIGQCCGGRVELAIRVVDDGTARQLTERVRRQEAARPHVYVFGGGHVGSALADALALLPVHTVIVETRAEELESIKADVDKRLLPVPEDAVRDAPEGSAFLVLTHDHALDFLIVGEALNRPDAAYVGMIGSKTKKATFRNWYYRNAGGTAANFERLVSPIGGDAVKDKRPQVIAALAAAEVMTALAMHQAKAKISAGD